MADAVVAGARGGVGSAHRDDARRPSSGASRDLSYDVETTSRRPSCEKLQLVQGVPGCEWLGERALDGERGYREVGDGHQEMHEHPRHARHHQRPQLGPAGLPEVAAGDEHQLEPAVT